MSQKLISKRLHNAALIFNWRVQHDLQREGLVLGSGWLRPLLVWCGYWIDGDGEMSKETGGPWKFVPGLTGIEVNALGKIRNWMDRRRNNPLLTTPRYLTASFDQAGYRILCLRDENGNKTTHRVCRMVLLAFNGIPEKGMQACHGNNIKDDDRLENLRWGTVSENTIDQVKHGVHRGLKSQGEKHPMHKLSLEQVLVIKQMISDGKSTIDIAKEFNVPRTTINSIKVGVSWKSADAMLKARNN